MQVQQRISTQVQSGGAKRIPAPVIGLLSKIFPNHYTHNGLNSLFLTAGAPDNIPQTSKPDKVTEWLRRINQECADPLEILGKILEEFMDTEPRNNSFYSTQSNEEAVQAHNDERERIIAALAKDGLQYVRSGHIRSGQGTATLSLMERIQRDGLPAIDIEVKRALDNVDKDPPAAVLAAGAVLEAAFKTYLERNGVPFFDTDTFSSLWRKCSNHMGMKPKEVEDEDLKKIVNGLCDIAEGLMHLRNRKSASHGKSDAQIKSYAVAPRHARLAVHAAHTLAAYILEAAESNGRR